MKVKLNDVRLTFPALFEAKAFVGADGSPTKPKFSGTFLFAPDHPAAAAVSKGMQTVAKEKWGEKAAAVYKQMKAGDKLALHDGAAKSDFAGYEGNLYVNASNALRPTVVDGNRSPLTIAEGKPYSGCYVNAIIELWAQDNQWGKRINASLMGVQFLRDGERLAGGAVAAEDDFDEIPTDSDASAEFGDDSQDDGFDSFA